MRTANLLVGTTVVDSLPYSQTGTPKQAQALWEAVVGGVAGYLGVINQSRVMALLDRGLAFLPTTLASEYLDGAADELAQLRGLGITNGLGVTVMADMEGLTTAKADPKTTIQRLDAWAQDILNAGHIPGIYVGVPQALTYDELYHLKMQRYWRGQGWILDRFNKPADHGIGWCMTQAYPSITLGGTLVDVDLVGQDYRGRVPTAVVA